jgi:hypothetical protein
MAHQPQRYATVAWIPHMYRTVPHLIHHNVLPMVLRHELHISQQDLVGSDNHGKLAVNGHACDAHKQRQAQAAM